ncbi:hypothetical protein TNCV_2928071 [Trichonephila clavipes]|nr:hypothetical protein TNCV_2928071 [Trichonephila clavipes]
MGVKIRPGFNSISVSSEGKAGSMQKREHLCSDTAKARQLVQCSLKQETVAIGTSATASGKPLKIPPSGIRGLITRPRLRSQVLGRAGECRGRQKTGSVYPCYNARYLKDRLTFHIFRIGIVLEGSACPIFSNH